MKRRLLFLALLLPLCVAAQPIIRQSLTTNTADNPSTGQSPVWNGTKWVMASTNQFGGGGGTPGGSTREVQYNNGGAFDGGSGLLLDAETNLTVTGMFTNKAGIYILPPVSTNVAQLNLFTTNQANFWRLQGPDALTNDFIVVPPTNHPTAGQVMAVQAYSGKTVNLTWAGAWREGFGNAFQASYGSNPMFLPWQGGNFSVSASDIRYSFPVAEGGIVSNVFLKCFNNSAVAPIGAGTNITMTLFTNGVSTGFAITLQGDGSAVTTNSGTQSVSLPAGGTNTMNWQFSSNTNTTQNINHTWRGYILR